MGELMSEETVRMSAHRKKRVQRLKKIIVLSLLLLVLVPAGLCAALLVRIRHMDRSMEQLASEVEALNREVSDQQARMQELLGDMQTTGYGSSDENGSGSEPPGHGPVTMERPSETVDTSVSAAHKVYLTFDDGPSANTEKILDILDSYDVKATFFVVGKEGDWARTALVDIVERGHSLGMHSYSHKYSELYGSVEDFAEDFVRIRSYLEDVTGVTSSLYRFPGGSSNTVSRIDMREFADYLDSWGVSFYDWNVASGDGGSEVLSVEELVENSLEGIENRETTVILLHDSAGKPTTVEALPQIIERIQSMDDTVLLPITDDTELIQHIHRENNN